MGFLTSYFKFKTIILFAKLFLAVLAIDIFIAILRLICGLAAREFF